MKKNLLCLLMLAQLAQGSAADSTPPPNFVVILGEGAGWTSTSIQMDDRNPESKGRGIRTPNLERLAAEGMRFSDAYAASPRCTPSRAALFTGRSPAALHMTFIGDGRRHDDQAVSTKLIPPRALLELPEESITLAGLLKPRGYATAHFGKWHVGQVSPARHGFDESDGPTGNGGPDNVANPNPKQALAMTAHGISFMERQVKSSRPFYLQMSHYPSQDEKRGGGKRRTPKDSREEMNTVDKTVGGVLDAIQLLGLERTTYVLYTTDHGTPGHNFPLTGGKGTVWEGGLRVPFIIQGPGIKAGACSHVRASSLDLLPTFAELAGITQNLPAGLEGGSLASVLHDEGVGTVQRSRQPFVVLFPHYDKDAQGPASAILLGDYKLIRTYETGSVRLYDLTRDPKEHHDLAGQLQDTVEEMNGQLSAYLSAVNAQMPKPNPAYNPGNQPSDQGRRSGRNRDD